jgi:hypothetical protein
VRGFRRSPIVLLLISAAALTGCASTRMAGLGPLPNDEKLVTLVVTEKRSTVEEHCRGAFALGPILGCQMMRSTTAADGRPVRTVKIVRYTDSLPSPMAFEIDLHELCHTVASLQTISDPCHADNQGLLQTSSSTALRPR